MNEIFRFAAQRAIQRAAPKEIEDNLFKTYGETQRSTFHQQLRDWHEQDDGAAMISAARAYISFTDFVDDLGTLNTPLATLDGWLLDRDDEAPPKQVSAQVQSLTAKSPDLLVGTNEYQEDRRKVADSLLALAVDPSGDEHTRAELMRAMQLFGLLERLAKPPTEALETAAEVRRLLTRGMVVLPSDIFPLPAGTPSGQPPVLDELEGEDIENSWLEPGSDVEVMLNHLDVLVAIKELNNVLTTITPRIEEVDGSQNGLATPWGLPKGSRISRATREVAEKVVGRTAFSNVPETINLLENRASALGAARVANGQPKTVLPFGNGFVELDSFERSAAGRIPERLPADALVRAPGIYDLKVVRQKLKKYERGEVAHIENVLKGESKERTHRRKTATETTLFTETERTEETEQDLQSTERFELQSEATKTTHQDVHLEGGLQVTASYGPAVQVSANAGFALNHSKDESSRQASNYARDVTARSVKRIQERVKEQRTIRTLSEVEETNTHGVENTGKGAEHVVGIYHWVDKVYEAQVFDYGERLLLEFSVPEPAAFFLHTLANRTPEGMTLEKPVPPVVVSGEKEVIVGDKKVKETITRPLGPEDITEITYLGWVQRYSVVGVSPPPKAFVTVSTAIVEPVAQSDNSNPPKSRTIFKAPESGGIGIPDGYKASMYHMMFRTDSNAREHMLIAWAVGNHMGHHAGNAGANPPVHAPWSFNVEAKPLAQEEGLLPVALYLHNVWGFAVTLEVLCERTEESLRRWQLDTYETIMRAYYEQKSRYDEQVAAAAAREGVGIAGRNPQQNREIEKAELKKAAITMLRGGGFEEFDAMGEGAAPHYPEIDVGEAQKEGRVIQFFEQAFEWPQMTYIFYPYFWGRKKRWVSTSQIDDPADPLFAAFLRAGAARVVVPVRPGFEDQVNHYLATDRIWGGGQVPVVGDPLYVSIAQEIRNQQGADTGGVPEGKPWKVRLPTTLTILGEDAKLPEFLT